MGRASRGGVALASRSTLIGAIMLTVAVGAAGCAGDPEIVGEDEGALSPLGPEKVDVVSQAPWDTIGTGVTYKTLGGRNVLVVHGGYTAEDVYVQRWADELFRARGVTLDIGHVYAVRGPNQSGYANREIASSKLAAHLEDGRAVEATSIVVIAHSSGGFVANELFSMLDESTLAKVTFFDLDGGPPEARLLGAMAGAYFVYACDEAIDRCSHNAGSMRALGGAYASLGGAVRVEADGSACSRASGGLWCLHDALVTTRPHDPLAYDLRRDYTDFDGGRGDRRVVTSYLDVLSR